MKKLCVSICLVVALLLCAVPVSAASNFTASNTTVSYYYDPGTESTYEVSIPEKFSLYTDIGEGFGITATSMNIVDGYELRISVAEETFANDGNFYLYLNGQSSSEYRMPCRIATTQDGSSDYLTVTKDENNVIATYRGTDTNAYAGGNVMFFPGSCTQKGTYSGTVVFNLAVYDVTE